MAAIDPIIEKISNLINDGIDDFNNLEKNMIALLEPNIIYRFNNERPIAAFLTEYFKEKLEDELIINHMHELPIEIDKKNKKGVVKDPKAFAKNKFGIDIDKDYKYFNVDAAIIREQENDKTSSEKKKEIFFIEYKVDGDKINKKNLIIDFIKYLIYTNDYDKASYFIYISLKKNQSTKKMKNSFIKKTSKKTSDKHPELKITTNANIHDDAVLHWFKKDKKDKDNIIMSEELKTQSLIDVTEIQAINNSELIRRRNEIIENDLIFKDSEEEYFKNINKIYGTNVALSKKARRNAPAIVKLNNNLSTEIKNFATDDKKTYNKIKEFLESIVKTNKETSDALKEVYNKKTNWLLLTIETGINFFHKKNTTFEDMTGIKQFEIRDCNKCKEDGKRPPKTPDMIKAIKGKIEKNEAKFKEILYSIIKHLSTIYNKILDLESGYYIAPYNDEYNNWSELKKIKKKTTKFIKKNRFKKIDDKKQKINKKELIDNLNSKSFDDILLTVLNHILDKIKSEEKKGN